MNFTDVLRLPCPSAEDYAALPIYMQRLAEDIEAKILAQRALITQFNNPQICIWRGGSFDNTFASTDSLNFFLGTPDIVFSNYKVPPFNQDPTFQITGSLFNQSGIWHLGVAVLGMFPTGATTNDSFRLLRVQVSKGTSGGTSSIVNTGRRVNAETGAVEYFTTEFTILVDEEFDKYRIDANITHGNVASTMTVPTNGMFAWVMRIGSADIIEVT